MPWDRVHDEAEVLEHVLSEELEEADRREARAPDARPARRSDPDASTSCSRSARRPACRRWSAGQGGDVRAHLRLRSRDAPLPLRARDQPGRRASRSSRSSRSTARSSCASASRSTCSAATLAAAMRVEAGRDATTARRRRRRRDSAGRRHRSRADRAPARRGSAGARRRAARPGVRRRGRLRRPGQLRHEHRRRREVRLPAAVGDPRGEPDGDADPVPLGEGRASRPGSNLPELCREHFGKRASRSASGSRPS